jgi:hypothetical protein
MIFDLKRVPKADRVQAFVPANGRSIAGFDQILLCWSAQSVEAIAA